MNYGSNRATSSAMSESHDELLPLKSVTFKGGKVELTYNSSNYLTSVAYYSQEGVAYTKQHEAILYQRLLQHDGNQPSIYYDSFKRNGLDSVKIDGYKTYALQYQRDSYHESVGIFGGYNTDFWGFFNGKKDVFPRLYYKAEGYSYFTGLQGTDPSSPAGSGTRGPVWLAIGEKMEKSEPTIIVPGIIKRVTYPTGGFAEYSFEPNQYLSSYDSRAVYGGGARIRSIKYATGDGRDSIIKVYKYGMNEDGTGRTKYQNYDRNFMSQQIMISYMDYDGVSVAFSTKTTTINNKPFLDMSFSSGAAVLYPSVSEYTISLPDSMPLGRTTYEYTIDSKNESWLHMTPLQPEFRTDWKVISLRNVANYRYKNGIYNIVNRTAYEYQDYNTVAVPAGQTYLRFFNSTNIDPTFNYAGYLTDPIAHAAYSITAGARRQTAVLDTLFNPDNQSEFIASRTDMEFEPSYFYKSKETKTDSKNAVLNAQFNYPFQVSSLTNLPTAQQSLMSALQTQNRIVQPVEVRRYNEGALMETVQQRYGTFSDGRIYPAAVYTAARTNPLEKVLEMLEYDSYGNVLEQRRADDVKEVYLWGYNGRYPVAKVVGSDYNTVKSFVDLNMLDNAQSYTEAQIRTELNKIRTGLANTVAQVFSYTYKPIVGMTSETDPNNVSRYYVYDSKNRLALIKDQHGNILKMICYNYSGTPQDCGTGL
ncbi:hypothetical protein MKQ70_36970 [Chitinophaga sedimenti]|uniref:hypothetical protein n=1 Tax=Chitinophaga sedimenti TaxID=2033606 RepID=UPI002005EDE6|nr:hypothetical protein [Chitinophaga sedimenti]MCK7560205.1 hypothetical protein [Chitinophaga sedimenti]